MSPSEAAYRNLVAAARAAGEIVPEERKVLNAYVLRLGLDADRARELETDAPERIQVPADADERRETLRALLEVVAADGSIAPRELDLARALAGPLSPKDLDRLLDAALRRDKKAVDRGLAGLALAAGLPAPLPPDTPLRSLPFAARWASAARPCQSCGGAFAARDRYEQYCRSCRQDVVDPRNSGRRGEWMTGVLCLLLMVPSAYLVERLTGLWSSGYAAIGSEPLRLRRGRVDTSASVYIMPAAALSLALAWGIAWVVGALYMRQIRRRRR